MERKSFIKSLLTLATAPKLIAELNIPAPAPVVPSAFLFKDLQLVTPHWLPSMLTKYGGEDFTFFMEAIGKTPMFIPHQVVEIKNGQMILRDATPEEIGKPVTITLNNHYT